MSTRVDRTGEKTINTYGQEMTVIQYNNTSDMTVEFDNGYIVYKCQYKNFKAGKIKSPHDKREMGVGFIGIGDFKPVVDSVDTIEYKAWRGMLRRAYSEKFLVKNPTYAGVTVCEEWHNFQNFAKWHKEHYYTVDGELIHLEKDIRVKGNKVYSPDTCMFVPAFINNLLLAKANCRGKFPMGVAKYKKTETFLARIGIFGEYISLGRFDSVEEAFEVYKTAKQQYIIDVANKYKSAVPSVVYESLLKYKVEITD